MSFKPTHEIITEDGETMKLMLVDGCAYQGHEWAESMISDITYDGSWKRNDRPFKVESKKVETEIEPDDFR